MHLHALYFFLYQGHGGLLLFVDFLGEYFGRKTYREYGGFELVGQVIDKIIGGCDQSALPVKRAQHPNNDKKNPGHKQQTRYGQPIELKQKGGGKVGKTQFQNQLFTHQLRQVSAQFYGVMALVRVQRRWIWAGEIIRAVFGTQAVGKIRINAVFGKALGDKIV